MPLKTPDLTIAIITFQRPTLLKQCLKSIRNQSPKQILIIDNDPKKTAFPIYNKFKKILPLFYITTPINNVPNARNIALNFTKTNHLAFIDDDCILDNNWLNQIKKTLEEFPNITFVQGDSTIQNSTNLIAQAQHQLYLQWQKPFRNKQFFDPKVIDTKNLVLNTKIIKNNNIKFSHDLAPFEDTDFGLQLKTKNIKGVYDPKLFVKHWEVATLKSVIKKSYYRGTIKYKMTKIWGNYDDFYPNKDISLKNILKLFLKFFIYPLHFKNNLISLIEFLINIYFNQGFFDAKNSSPKIYIINVLDRSANEERARALSLFLKINNYKTKIIDSQKLFSKYSQQFSGFLISPIYFVFYRLTRLILFKLKIKNIYPLHFYLGLLLRGKIIKNYLIKKKAKIVISQYPEDLVCSHLKRPYHLILDTPTIYSQEVKLNNNLSPLIEKKITNIERKAFKDSDYVSFHWYQFFQLATKLKYPIRQPLTLNWGCYSKLKVCSYSSTPKIIYIGNINSKWINPNLLNHLSQTSNFPVTIYSYEKPNKTIYSPTHLNYQGFLKSTDQINSFQFGLITLTDDILRNHGFSAKHLLYLSYGLPVLCPDSRKDPKLSPATIYYNKKNFNKVIKKYNNPILWHKKHLAAVKLAKKFSWENNLKNLLPAIQKLETANS